MLSGLTHTDERLLVVSTSNGIHDLSVATRGESVRVAQNFIAVTAEVGTVTVVRPDSQESGLYATISHGESSTGTYIRGVYTQVLGTEFVALDGSDADTSSWWCSTGGPCHVAQASRGGDLIMAVVWRRWCATSGVGSAQLQLRRNDSSQARTSSDTARMTPLWVAQMSLRLVHSGTAVLRSPTHHRWMRLAPGTC